MRDRIIIDSEQHQCTIVGEVERLPRQSAAVAGHEIDPVEYKAARTRIGGRRGKTLRIGAQLVGAVEPRPGETRAARTSGHHVLEEGFAELRLEGHGVRRHDLRIACRAIAELAVNEADRPRCARPAENAFAARRGRQRYAPARAEALSVDEGALALDAVRQ